MSPQLTQFTDYSLLLLRLMVAAVFATSGWSHLKDPKGRAHSIGMSPSFTAFLGAAELAGALGVAFGVLTQLAAAGLDIDHARRHSKEDFCLAHRLREGKLPGGTMISCSR